MNDTVALKQLTDLVAAGKCTDSERKLVNAIAQMDEMLTAAEQKHAALVELLRRARSDIFQTARSNQCNLTGKDISFLHDAAQPERIGKTPVHQSDITESLSLVKEIDAALAQQDQPAGEVLDADTLTIYFRGDITKPHSLTSEDYDKLKASGMLWELYPDAPDHFIAATAR